MRNLTLLSAVALLLALSTQASALSLVYEEGPNMGQAYGGTGPLFLKLRNFDMGTLYGQKPIGFTAGGQPLNPAQVAADTAAMNLLPGQVAPVGAVGSEDSWGIARVNRIEDSAGYAVWTQAAKHTELVSFFWGEQDFRLEQININQQHIDGAGMHLALYEQALPLGNSTPGIFNPALGSAGRTAFDQYTTVTTEGQVIFTANSVPGFLHDFGAAEFGGGFSEFESIFNQTSRTGEGEAFFSMGAIPTSNAALDALDGLVDGFMSGSWNDRLDTDYFQSLVTNPVTGSLFNPADLRLKFTTAPNGPVVVGDWLVTSFDPMEIHLAVPEPMTMIGLAMGLVGVGGYIRRRRSC